MVNKTNNNYQKKSKSKKKSTNKKASLAVWLFSIAVTMIVIMSLLSMISSPEVEEVPDEIPKEDFVAELVPYAQELQKEYNILPSIILSQAILESDWGRSELGRTYNNLFGVKAYGDQEKVNLTTKEFENGQWLEINAYFRVFSSWRESMTEHTQLFVQGVTWNPQLYQGVLQAKNYREAAQALQESGYATDPDYARKIIEVIESYNLAQYDQ